MKFLLKLIFYPLIFIGVLLGTIIFLLTKSVQIPKEYYEAPVGVNLSDMIKDEVDSFLTEHDENSSLSIGLSQNQIHHLIVEQLRSQNTSYALESTTDPNLKNYVIKEDYFGYQGSWTRFKKDTIEIESGAHIFVAGITFKTRLLLVLKVETDLEETNIKLDKVTIGRLPLAWMFGTANKLIKNIAGQDIEGIINEQLQGYGTFDPNTRTLNIKIDEAVSNLTENDSQAQSLIKTLIAFVQENELVNIGIDEDGASVSLALGKISDKTEPFVLDEADKIADDTEMQAILMAKGSTLVVSLLSTNSDPFIQLDAFTLNRFFEFFSRDAQVDGVLMKTTYLEDYTLEVGIPFVTIVGSEFLIQIPVKMYETDDDAKAFQTIIKLQSTPSFVNDDLAFSLDTARAGLITLGSDHIVDIIAVLGETEFIVDGKFVIKDFTQTMNQSGMEVKDVVVENGQLKLFVQPNVADFEDLQNVISEVLEDLLNTTTLPEEFTDALADLLDNPADPDQAIQAVLDAMENLDDEELEDLFNELESLLENSEYSFEDIFNN
ncbi:MAG: hypothetical protein WC964_00965 [Acholeplasmataceae bacterium]